ncbi:MAG: HEAT repeat domain-containing protein [Candidatus Anammoxibacter sp.]
MSIETLKSKRINILVVDNQEIILNQLKSILTNIGHDVTCVSNGEDAIEKIKHHNFKIVITDLIMPGLHGIDLLRAIKGISHDVSIVVLIRNQNMKLAMQALKMGAYDYIKTPLDIDEFEIIVKRAIERCNLLYELENKLHYKNLLIEKAIADLKSSDETVRRLAAEDIGEFKDKSTVDVLLELFDDESIAVQEAAEDALIKIGDEDTVKKVIPMLKSNKANIRNFATEMLENLGKKAIPTLSELITDEDHDVRKFAVDVLGSIGCIEGVEPLIRALNDRHVNVSSGAAEALGNIGDKQAVDPLLKKLNGDIWLQYAVIDSLGRIADKKAVEPLISHPDCDDEVLLTSKIRALGAIGDVRATRFLFSLFKDVNEFIKGQIVESLEQIWEKSKTNIFEGLDQREVFKQMIPMLKVPDTDLKLSVIRMMGKMECDNLVDALLPSLSDSSEEISETAYESIVAAGVQGTAVDLLLDSLKTKNDDLKQNIIKILGDARCEKAGEVVVDLLKNDPSSSIRETAANTLGLLPDKRKHINCLVDALGDGSFEVRKAAIHSLGIIQDTRAIEHIVSILGDKDVNEEAVYALIRVGGESTFDQLYPLLKDNDPLVKSSAITIMGSIRHKFITKELSEALNDQSAQVRKASIDVIAKTKNGGLVDDLITALHDNDRFVQIAAANALSKLDDPRIIEPLIVAIQSADERIRYKAVEGLMLFKEDRIIYAIVSLLSDKSNMVKIIAMEALGQIGNQNIIHHLENMLETAENDDIYDAANNAIGKLQLTTNE